MGIVVPRCEGSPPPGGYVYGGGIYPFLVYRPHDVLIGRYRVCFFIISRTLSCISREIVN